MARIKSAQINVRVDPELRQLYVLLARDDGGLAAVTERLIREYIISRDFVPPEPKK